MLPVESVADAISFLGYYDLGGLKLTSKLFSAVASRCSDAIRLFDFSDFTFCIWGPNVHVYPLGWTNPLSHRICKLELPNQISLAEFIAEALRNCTVGHIASSRPRKIELNAIKGIANTIAVGYLEVSIVHFESLHELFEFLDSFRQLEELSVRPSRTRQLTLDEKASIDVFCQRKNITLRP